MLSVSIVKALGEFRLEVDFEADREILVLFGPSGAGKTMTLQCLAGLTAPDLGSIKLDGQAVFEGDGMRKRILPPHRRRIGYVFQEYALFPHLTVRQNIGYGIRRPRAERQARVSQLLERMRLAELGDRYPDQLSGGQQQRVAIARALAPDPQVVLLDEPFAALDGAVREHLREDLQLLQRQQNLTMIYVTHSLEDAFAIGNRLAVLNDGRLEQVGSVAEVFRRPWTPVVASALGASNVFQARVVEMTAQALVIEWNGNRLRCLPQPAQIGQRVAVYIRPEDIKILYPDRPVAEAVRHNQLSGTVVRIVPRAAHQTVFLRVAGSHRQREYDLEMQCSARAYQSLGLSVGKEVTVSIRIDGIHILRSPSGEGERAPAMSMDAQNPVDDQTDEPPDTPRGAYDRWSAGRQEAVVPSGEASQPADQTMTSVTDAPSKLPRVLFVCIGNSCRSQMAEGFARAYGAGIIEVESAGTAACGWIAPLAIGVMRERDLDIMGQSSKQLKPEMIARADRVITLGCCTADNLCPVTFVGGKEDWPIKDPMGGPVSDFRRARDEIEERVKDLLERIKGSAI